MSSSSLACIAATAEARCRAHGPVDRHGYPNVEQWMALTRASDQHLHDAAALGDTVAAALLNQRRLMAGDDAAIKDMLDATAAGSTFSLELLATDSVGANTGGDRGETQPV